MFPWNLKFCTAQLGDEPLSNKMRLAGVKHKAVGIIHFLCRLEHRNLNTER